MSWGAQELFAVLLVGVGLMHLYAYYSIRTQQRLLSQGRIDQETRNRLAAELLDGHSREQRRMSSELHDGVGQNLAGIALLVESFAPQLQNSSADAATKLKSLLDLLESTRRLAEERVIDPRTGPELELDNGLARALQGLAKNLEDLFGVQGSVSGTLPRLERKTAGHLYRLAEEAAYNAVRHAGPQQVRFALSHESNEACLQIEDDGQGIRGQPDPKGRGQHLMSLRARKIGGTLETVPLDAGGTRVTCRWSLDYKDSR